MTVTLDRRCGFFPTAICKTVRPPDPAAEAAFKPAPLWSRSLQRLGVVAGRCLAILAIVSVWPPAARAQPPDLPKGVELVLTLGGGPKNPRNGEGDFIRLKDGRILFVYTHFTGGSGDESAAFLAGRYSSDGGKTWTTDDAVVVPNEGQQNVMEVSLLRFADQRIGLWYARKNSLDDCRPYVRFSSDEAKTWSEPVLCIQDQVGYYAWNHGRVIQLGDGRILLPVALHNTPSASAPDWQGQVIVYLSDDGGKTYRRSKSVLLGKGKDGGRVTVQEPGIVAMSGGQLLLYCRTDAGSQWISRSHDGGDTWSELEPSNILSPLSPASIFPIPKTGDWMLVWNNYGDPKSPKDGRRTPYTVAVSRDEGKTWENAKNLGEDPKIMYCYAAAEFVDDHVLLAYYTIGAFGSREGSIMVRFPIQWLYAKP